MKKLGDGAIHPGDGDVRKQSVLDADLIAQLTHTLMLLFLIYVLKTIFEHPQVLAQYETN
jgi:hypothetical protein